METISLSKIIICVVLMAIVSYLPRVIPLALMKRKIKNPFICSLLTYLPYGLLAAMIFPDVFFALIDNSGGIAWEQSVGPIICASVGAVVSVVVSLIKHTGLFTVTVCGCTSVLITQIILTAVGMM